MDDMDKFEQREMKKIRKSVDGFKDKIVLSLFKTNTPKQAVYGRGKKLG